MRLPRAAHDWIRSQRRAAYVWADRWLVWTILGALSVWLVLLPMIRGEEGPARCVSFYDASQCE